MSLVIVSSTKWFHSLQLFWEMLLSKWLCGSVFELLLFLSSYVLFSNTSFSWGKSSHSASSFTSFCHGVETLMAFPAGTWWDWPGCKSVACTCEVCIFLNSSAFWKHQVAETTFAMGNVNSVPQEHLCLHYFECFWEMEHFCGLLRPRWSCVFHSHVLSLSL